MTVPEAALDTPTQRRTRNAILQAAATVLSQNPAAPLGEVADAAGVARSTLHRYFPERQDLIERLRTYAEDEIARAGEEARLDQGTAIEALVRLTHEYFDRWPVIMWLYLDGLRPEQGQRAIAEELDPSVSTLVARGHADGTIDPGLPDPWIQQMLGVLLYSAWDYTTRGGDARHETLALTITTLRRLVARPGGSPGGGA